MTNNEKVKQLLAEEAKGLTDIAAALLSKVGKNGEHDLFKQMDQLHTIHAKVYTDTAQNLIKIINLL